MMKLDIYCSVLAAVCTLSFSSAHAGESEAAIIASCFQKTGGDPTATAICAGGGMTLVEVKKCLTGGDCFGENNTLRKAFESLFGRKKDNGPQCGNFDEKPQDGGNKEFSAGKSWRLCSGYEVAFQADGNLVVYNPRKVAVWASNTQNQGADQLSMQGDGNLVIYRRPTPIWSTNTPGNPGAFLAIQEDGNLVVYKRDLAPLWATGTNGK